jgi:hypothetical protein
MKTIRYALLSAISLGAAMIPSIANAQSVNHGEWRHGRNAPAVVVAPPVVTRPVAVALPPVPVPVVAPRVTLRASIGPNVVYAHGRRTFGNGVNGDGLGNAREIRQEQQIRIASMRGQLTPREYNRLMQGQAQIDSIQAQVASDGVVTPFEARQIQQAQAVQAREIARLESNRRGGGRR